MIASFDIPTQIYINEKDEFIENVLSYKEKNILLALTLGMEERAGLCDFVQKLSDTNEVVRVSKLNSNPTDEDLCALLKTLKKIPDIVIAIGGGSAIDLCKGIIALDYFIGKPFSKEDITNAVEKKEYKFKNHNNIEFLAVPTTSGTGSEVTSWGTIWKADKTSKMSVDDARLSPDKAYIIYEFTKYMPKRLTLSTGLDALTHATESYWSKKSNAITRELSKTSIEMIMEYLPKTLQEPDNLVYREKMCIASLFAGLAFANTRTTACHSISYPLTMKYGIEHGFACAITLTEVMRRNRNSIVEFDRLLDVFGVTDTKKIDEWLTELCKDIQLIRLSEFGICKEDINEIVKATFTAGRMDNNPVEFDEAVVHGILEKCM